jgi:hypothetical protein
MEELSDLLTEQEAALLVGKFWTFEQFQTMRSNRKGPVYSRVGSKVIYRRQDVLDWLDKRVKEGQRSAKANPAKQAAGRKAAEAKGYGKPKPTSKPKPKPKAAQPVEAAEELA